MPKQKGTAAQQSKGKLGATKTASSKRPKKRTRAPVSVTCKATKRNGKPCGLPPIKGGTVCHKHGGSAPQVRAAANRRLIEMVLPAMKELHKIIDRDDVADADKLRAIQMVLNRTGYSERQQIDIGLREPTPFDNLTADAFVIMRGRENVIDPADETPELPTPDQAIGDGDGEDDALEAFLDQRERARQREAETRIDNTGHDVVPGEVHQRPAADPFFMEERRRAEWERSATEFDPRAPKDDPYREYADRLRERVEESERRTGRKR